MRYPIYRTILRIVLPYMFFAGLWILLSDKALQALVEDPAAYARWSIVKGWGFVLVTALLLSGLLHFTLRKRQRAFHDLEARVAERTAKLRESMERQQRLADEFGRVMDYSLDAICVFDEHIRFVRASNASEVLWGYRPEELLGKCYLDLVPAEDREAIMAAARGVRDGEGTRILEGRALRRDGTRVHIVWSVAWSPSDRLWYCIARDDTERRQLLKELRRRAEALEQSSSELAVAKEAAEAADRLKSAFLATMSHELRTPLNSIIGFTGLVLQELPGPLNAEQKKQLGMVRDSARHLLTLINDVLDISKIEAGELEVVHERFDLAASVNKVFNIIKPLADKKRLMLKVEMSGTFDDMTGDGRRTEQILLNLLSNAVKFTERGSITLSVDRAANYTPDKGEKVRLRVADSGIGIKPDDLTQLFQPFRQIDSTLSRKHEGTGLGLAICRRLAELMGGHIEVESRWGEGSVFTLILPMHSPASEEAK